MSAVHCLIIGRELSFALGMIMVMRQTALAGGLLKLGAGSLDEKEDGFEMAEWAAQRMTGNDYSHTAMPFALMIKSELDLGANLKRPLGEQADSFGRPLDLFLNEID